MGGGELGTHNEAPPAPRRTRPHHRRHRRTTRPTDTPQYTASHRRDDSVAWCGGVVTTAKHASVQNESGTEEASPQVTLKAGTRGWCASPQVSTATHLPGPAHCHPSQNLHASDCSTGSSSCWSRRCPRSHSRLRTGTIGRFP